MKTIYDLIRRIADQFICAFALVTVLFPAVGWAESRIALVVGNGSYVAENIPMLENPVNDANLMAQVLEKSGFEVRLVTDADQGTMKTAIKAFGEQLEQTGGDSVGLFYYAGHGVEVRGHNYLIPIGAEIERAVEFKTDAVPMDWVLSWMESVDNRMNLVILDSCRNNPFEGRYRGASQGLAQMDAPSGSLIAYSAAPGQVALDGKEGEENSPYTAALAQALVDPGVKVEDVFKRVRVAVETATSGQQTPWESSSLRGDFYFVANVEKPPTPKPSPSTVTTTISPELTVSQTAARAYEAAERLHTISSYQLVVGRFPGTVYAGLAKEQIERLKAIETKPSPEEEEASLGLKRAEQELIQISLWALGFNSGPPDGFFGKRTRKEIRKWQASQNEPATGYLDKMSAKVLLAAVPDLSGPIWLVAQNQPCKVWNANPQAGEVLTWSGGCVDDKASGKGRKTWRNRDGESIYQGEYRDGKKHGRGTYTWPSGDRYEGEYRDGKHHGRGTYTWPSGDRYEGEYRDGKQHGRGTKTWRSGSRYEGEYRDGKRHGRGTYTWPSGDRYEGEYRDGKQHGRGTYTWPDGSRYDGEWRDGKQHR